MYHHFSGNGNLPVGKMIKKTRFTRGMTQLGNDADISGEIYHDLEAYVYIEVRD